MTAKPIDYKFHATIVAILLLIQFFILDIYGFFYLRHVINKNSVANSSIGTLYRKGEYVPVDSHEVPPDYKVVLVKRKGELIEEIYYAAKGQERIIDFLNGKWQRSSDGNIGALIVFLFLPLCGFILFSSAILRKAARTGTFFTWQLAKYPYDRFERICFIYGIPLHVSAIVFGLLGRRPN